jgi:AcrR family transcriptional regulator
MSPESKRARARRVDAQHNRAALLSAAGRLFEERGPEVALDEVARAAGVANATLYRHFATRAELLLAVYESEVEALGELAERLLRAPDPGAALSQWLRAFVDHVATKRELALALPDGPDGRRGERFAEWHAAMHTDTERLTDRARGAGAVRPGVGARELLTLATGVAMTGMSGERLEALLDLMRSGYAP